MRRWAKAEGVAVEEAHIAMPSSLGWTSFLNYQSTGKMVDGCSCGRKISLSSEGGTPIGRVGRTPRACISSQRSLAGRTSWRLNENDAFACDQWVGRVACGRHKAVRWHCTISGRSLAFSPHLKGDVRIMTNLGLLLAPCGVLNGSYCQNPIFWLCRSAPDNG